MKTPFASKSISQPVRRRVDLAIAVSQERLLATHVEHALDLIELVGDQVPFDDALDIYTRLLRLSDDEARIITTRALAFLGEDGSQRKSWPERMAEADAAADLGRARFGLFGNLRQRFRGRINENLRRWIELEAARTEVALLGSHVENALSFVEILDEELPFTEAVELYLEALDVRESIGEVVYYLTLARLNERLIPERHARPIGSEPARANPAASRSIRMMDG
ncbi:MAG TPA: hypothetical protein VF158_17645 [Longimicrobiales bacterium]